MTHTKTYPLVLLLVVSLVGMWSAIHPHDSFTWLLESLPVLIAMPLLILTYSCFRWANLMYSLIALHAVILLIGAHYTYAEVPLFNWLRDSFHFSRNHYDRLGHVAPALAIRELLLRTSPLKPGKWLFSLILFSCLGISAIYEIMEWVVAVTTGEAAEAFLGTQGDPWDTQIDMAFAGVGALFSLVCFSATHNRELLRSGTVVDLS